MGTHFATVISVLVLVGLEPLGHVGAARVVALLLSSKEAGLAVMIMALVKFIASKSISASGAFEFKHTREKLPEDGLPWYFGCPQRHDKLVELPGLIADMMSDYFSISVYENLSLGALLPLKLGFGEQLAAVDAPCK